MKINKYLLGVACMAGVALSSCQKYDSPTADLNYYVEGKEDVLNPAQVYAGDVVVFYYDDFESDGYVIWPGDPGHDYNTKNNYSGTNEAIDGDLYQTAYPMRVDPLKYRHYYNYSYSAVGTFDATLVVSKVTKPGEFEYATDSKTLTVKDTATVFKSFKIKYWVKSTDNWGYLEAVVSEIGETGIITVQSDKFFKPDKKQPMYAAFDAGNSTVYLDGVQQKSEESVIPEEVRNGEATLTYELVSNDGIHKKSFILQFE